VKSASKRSLPGPGILATPTNLPVSEAPNEVIVHHANGLHVRVDDRRADEAESPRLEIETECVGLT